MNVFVFRRDDSEVIARYEIHLAGADDPPPDQRYFDGAWERAVADGLVDASSREDYGFRLQKPKTLYESSQ
jgi:hypothetical protein